MAERKTARKTPDYTLKRVMCDALNIRKVPNGDVVRIAFRGEELHCGDEADGWREVKGEGFAMDEYLG